MERQSAGGFIWMIVCLFWGGGVEGDFGPVGMGAGMDLDGCGRGW